MIPLIASLSEDFGQSDGTLWFIAAVLGIGLIYGLILLTRHAHLSLDKEFQLAEDRLKEKTP
jgi:hypothetical protein